MLLRLDADFTYQREMACCKKFREKNSEKKWYIAIATFCKLVVHFGLVMLFLFGGSFLFVYIEDPKMSPEDVKVNFTSLEDFHEKIEAKYDLNISKPAWKLLYHDFKDHLAEYEENLAIINAYNENQDRDLIFQKWFYFTNIVATTVGKKLYHQF